MMTEERTIFLRPITSVYFGSPGSFNAGEMAGSVRGSKSMFPPPISSFQGMIRTKLLIDSGITDQKEIPALVGKPKELPNSWALQGPFPVRLLEKRLDIWFPVPKCLFPSPQAPVKARLFYPPEEEKFLADKNFEGLHLAGVPCKNEKPLSGWVSSQNLFWALSNRSSSKWNENEYSSEDLPPFVWWEFKPGLGIDRERRVAKEGMLYFLSSLRFKDNAGLIGWFKGKLAERLSEEALKRGVITAGKKWGVMAFEEISLKDPYWEKLAKGEHLKDISLPAPFYVWIVLLSPGKPPYKEALERPLLKIAQEVSSDISIEVVSVITGKSVKFSGFSFVEKRPKRISHWFPPGASFLVRISGGSLEERKQVLLLWNNTCMFAEESLRAFGYGHIIVSVPIEKSWREKWKEEEIYW